jgi:hypothetical protein
MAKEEGGGGNWRSLPQLLSHHKHYKSMSQRPIGKRVTKDVKVWTKGRDHVMNKLFNGQKHKPKVTQNCPLDFPKFYPFPKPWGQPPPPFFFPWSGAWKLKGGKRQTTRRAMQRKGHNNHHPPFMVKNLIHWARVQGWEEHSGNGKMGVPAQSWAMTLGNIHSPFARVWGPTQTPNLVWADTLQTVRYHFLRYLMLMVPFLRTPARFKWPFFLN